jgi:CubicO group peptidase (beta-lactamase class C family)
MLFPNLQGQTLGSARKDDMRYDTRSYERTIGKRSIPLHERVYTERAFESGLIDATRSHIYHVMRAQGTPGLNLAVGYRGKIIWEAGFGYADVATQRPMTPETVYHSGSLGKTYTATAVMHLADQGVIGLDDPINRHLPFAVQNPKGDRDITIRDLMTHHSGLNGDAAASRFEPPNALLDVVREEFATDPQARRYGPRWTGRVGESFDYSNLGLAALGLIVETANHEGLSFSAYVQKYVMDPLGMTASQYPAVQDRVHVRPDIWDQMSTGYARMGSAWMPTLPVYFGNYPAGGVLAKPSDHLRLMFAMLGDGAYNGYQLLRPETVRAMLAPVEEGQGPISWKHPPSLRSSRQGLIWRVSNVGEIAEKFWHSGGHMFGWRTQGVAWPRFELAVVVAANQWALPDSATDVPMIEEFIEGWVKQVRDVEQRAASAAWAEKVSYVRGVVFALSYKTSIGIPESLPQRALAHSIQAARLQPDCRDDWDQEAFERGVSDVSKTDWSFQALRAFWRQNTVVTEEEARSIHAELGGSLEQNSYSIELLPALPSASRSPRPPSTEQGAPR